MPFPSPGDLPDPGIEPVSPAFQADALTSESREAQSGRRLLGAMWETWVRSRGWEDPLEEGKATHSSILA